jgi:probable F420-dependent oxidoreductase
MKIGVFSFNTDYGMRADTLARALEERAFESLWVGEHTHIPASRRSPYPGGGELPRPYYHMLDPFVSLMAAGSATTKLKLGTGICLAVERDPITLAKEVATLDWMTGGRVLFGIGGGWNAEEMEHHGTAFRRRFKVLREHVEAMKAIWSSEEASYAGEFVQFDRVISNPKPVQTPHPPIIYGGNTQAGLKRVVRYCDGWLPFDVNGEKLEPMVNELHALARAAGRNPAALSITVFCFSAPSAQTLERYRRLGAERVVVVAPRQPEALMHFLDDLVPLTALE